MKYRVHAINAWDGRTKWLTVDEPNWVYALMAARCRRTSMFFGWELAACVDEDGNDWCEIGLGWRESHVRKRMD